MLEYLKAVRAERRARNAAHLALIEWLMAENERRLKQIRAEQSAPCRLCAAKNPDAVAR